MKKLIYTIMLILMISTFTFSQWTQTGSLPGYIYSLAEDSLYVFAGTSGNNGDVYRSADGGWSWGASAHIWSNIWSLLRNNTIIYAGTDRGIYYSTNHGSTVSPFGLNNNIAVYSILINSPYTFAGTDDGVYRSSNGGSNWSLGSINYSVNSITMNNGYIFAGTYGGVYISNNNGQSWALTSLTGHIYPMLTNNSIVFAGSGGVYRSTDNGITWSYTLAIGQVNSLIANGTNVFAGADNGVYVSINNGLNWVLKNEGMGNLPVISFTISQNYIYAGTRGNSGWKRFIGELTGIKPINTTISKEFQLEQNYPNPFNPTTTIRFDLSKSENVKLIIYDILGREVTVLVNEHLTPGKYETEWNASNYPSGVYFYKLINENYSDTRKMILIK